MIVFAKPMIIQLYGLEGLPQEQSFSCARRRPPRSAASRRQLGQGPLRLSLQQRSASCDRTEHNQQVMVNSDYKRSDGRVPSRIRSIPNPYPRLDASHPA